jgi:protein TonB
MIPSLLRHFWSVAGAALVTAALFLILPLLQVINQPPESDLGLQTVGNVQLPPPPPPPPEEPEKEEEPEEEPPELIEEAPPLDLAQLELALNHGLSGDLLAGDFTVRLNTASSESEDVDALFSLADLDQEPRAIHQPNPALDRKVRQKAPGAANVIFIVDQRGRVEQASVQSSSDPVFEAPALAAVRQWRFEPGRRSGEPVRFRMRVTITFPKGN